MSSYVNVYVFSLALQTLVLSTLNKSGRLDQQLWVGTVSMAQTCFEIHATCQALLVPIAPLFTVASVALEF